MMLSKLDKERIREMKDSIKIMRLEDTGNGLQQIKFNTEADILTAFYSMLRYKDKKFWEDNRETLKLIKNHIRNNLNRRKLN